MTSSSLLKRIYHLFIKRDILGPFALCKYGHIGKNTVFYRPYVHDRNRRLLSIGDDTTLLKDSRIQIYSDLVKSPCSITIGDNCYLGYHLTLLAGADIVIEDGVLMASNILISSENHSMNPELDEYYMDQSLSCKPITIREGSWIGEKVCILPGVTIGKKSIVGAGSVVTKSIPDYCIAVGSPAKVIKKYDFEKHMWVNY